MARPPQRPGRPTQPQRVRRRANRRLTAQQRNCSPACPQPSLAALHPKHPQSAARAGAAPPAPTPGRAAATPEPPAARTRGRPTPPRANTMAPPASPVAAAPVRGRHQRSRPQGPAKLFVLDTNVLLHDPTCLFRFEEHDIFLPMIVLEELDSHKNGMTEVARNGRQASR